MKSIPCLFIALFLLLLLTLTAHAQDVFTLTAESLQNGQAVELDKLGWKYSPADDPRFADPQFDDRAWESIQGTSLMPERLPKSGWRGLGWFRLQINVDAALVNQALALVMAHHGASEIYLDGKLLQRYGKVGATPETEMEANPGGVPLEVVLTSGGEHLLAVRRSQARWQKGFDWRGPVLPVLLGSEISAVSLTETGFRLQLDRLSTAHVRRDNYFRRIGVRGVFIGAIFATLGLLHLLFFFFYPPQRANLWFGLYCLCILLLFALARMSSTSVQEFAQGLSATMNLFTLGYFLTGCLDVLVLAFLYTSFEERLPRAFYVFAVIRFLSGFLVFLFPSAEFSRWIRMSQLLLVPFVWLRVVFHALRRKEAGAVLIGLGVALFSFNPLNSLLVEIGYGQQNSAFIPLQQFASLTINLLFSVYLARQFARTNRNLETQLEQVLQLSAKELEHERERARMAEVEAEHERKTKELEEARQLQLSMLPKRLPDLPHLDIAAFMKTATEVGGDYYDFHLGDDGTMTIAVGDATGHGLKAGTMVSVVKGLFDTLAYHPDIPHIFERLTRTLKRMNLRGLFMAMTVAKIKQHQLVVSVAGMPPVLLYRAASQQIEVIELKALPLGGVVNYRYQQLTFALAAGDAVVLLSDGLPERFNAQGEMLGEEPVQALLAQVGSQSAADIIAALLQAGEAWAGAHPQDDDVTLVVLKVK